MAVGVAVAVVVAVAVAVGVAVAVALGEPVGVGDGVDAHAEGVPVAVGVGFRARGRRRCCPRRTAIHLTGPSHTHCWADRVAALGRRDKDRRVIYGVPTRRKLMPQAWNRRPEQGHCPGNVGVAMDVPLAIV